MASGHVNPINRPNTWLHRPMLQNVKKALANPEPSTHGAKRSLRLFAPLHRLASLCVLEKASRTMPAANRRSLEPFSNCRRGVNRFLAFVVPRNGHRHWQLLSGRTEAHLKKGWDGHIMGDNSW